MHIDLSGIVAKHERELDSMEKLWKLRLVARRTDLTLIVAYLKFTNATMKALLKTKVRLQTLLWRTR